MIFTSLVDDPDDPDAPAEQIGLRHGGDLAGLTRVLEAVPSAQHRDRLWGLRGRALLLRGEAQLSLGRNGPARADLEELLDSWDENEPLTEQLRERARRGLASIPPM